MPKKHEIKYTPVAIDDLDEIFSYIAQENIAAAEMLLEKLNDDCEYLKNVNAGMVED